jgi:hypothetical protein
MAQFEDTLGIEVVILERALELLWEGEDTCQLPTGFLCHAINYAGKPHPDAARRLTSEVLDLLCLQEASTVEGWLKGHGIAQFNQRECQQVRRCILLDMIEQRTAVQRNYVRQSWTRTTEWINRKKPKVEPVLFPTSAPKVREYYACEVYRMVVDGRDFRANVKTRLALELATVLVEECAEEVLDTLEHTTNRALRLRVTFLDTPTYEKALQEAYDRGLQKGRGHG